MLNIIIALFCSFLWAGVTIATKILASQIPALAFTFIRYALVVLFLLPSFIYFKEYQKLRMADIPAILFLGLSLVLIFNTLFFLALYYASATSVAIIGATNPIFMMSVAVLLLRLSPSWAQLISFFLAFMGAIIVIMHGKMGFAVFTESIGELITVAAVVCQTFYAMGLRKVNTQYSPLFVTFATGLAGLLFVFPFIANDNFAQVLTQLTVDQWALFAFISFLGSTAAIFMYAYAMKQLGPALISLIVFTTMPIFTIILAFFMLGETFSIWQLVGSILVVSSLILGLRQTRQ